MDVQLEKMHHSLMKMDVKLEKMHCNMQRSCGSNNDDESSEEKDEIVPSKDVPKDAKSVEGLGSD
jgi:hypothetical protein